MFTTVDCRCKRRKEFLAEHVGTNHVALMVGPPMSPGHVAAVFVELLRASL